MIKTLYLLYNSDSYEIEVDNLHILAIWRFASNKPRIPECINYTDCEEELKNRIDDKLMTIYGEPSTD